MGAFYVGQRTQNISLSEYGALYLPIKIPNSYTISPGNETLSIHV
jgi:hypothetical protein